MARAYPRGPTAEEEQRNLEAFERYARTLETPSLLDSVDVYSICDWCVHGTPEVTLPITRCVMGSDERVPVFICKSCQEKRWLVVPWWRRGWWILRDWWNR